MALKNAFRPGVSCHSGVPAPEEMEDKHDQCDHEHDVHESAGNMERKPAAPKDEK